MLRRNGRRLSCVALLAFYTIALASAVQAAPLERSSAQTDRPEGFETPPLWTPGEWWRIRITGAIAGDEHEATIIVAAREGDSYLLGTPADDLSPAVALYHFFPLGRVNANDLSYPVHNQPFVGLRFPLREGDAWTTQFSGLPLEAHVRSVDEDAARVEFFSPGELLPAAVALYSPTLGTFSQMEVRGQGGMVVLDHGTGYGCVVAAPREVTLLFLYASGAPVAIASAFGPPEFFGSREVSRSYDTTALMVLAGGPEAAHAMQVLAPDGTAYETHVLPTDANRYTALVTTQGDPRGTWHFNRAGADPGLAFAEAVGLSISHIVPVLGVPEMNHETESCAAAPAAAAAVPASRPLGPGISKAPEFLPWVGVGVAVALAPFLLLRENNLRRLLPLVVPLYARIERDDVLANEIRRDIIAVVQANPGITTQEVRRALEIGWGTAVHHLLVLERHGFLVSVKWGRNRDWYPGTQGPARERLALSALRRDAARAVFDVISAHPGIGQKELADELALHHTTVLFHVRRLETAQLIEVIREHRRARYFPASQARQAPNGNETSRGAAHPSA